MATSLHSLHSGQAAAVATPRPVFVPWDYLDDDRILIDIETDMIIRANMEPKSSLSMERILRRMHEGRILGPLSVLMILLLYSLLSPLLPSTVHEYIYHILH